MNVRRAFAAACLLASAASAHYQFVRYQSSQPPFRPIYHKFDVNALPNKTLTYFVTETDALQLAPDDTWASFVSQVRAAAKAWNDVETSDLRLAYGGSATPGATFSSPSIEVMVEELPPGVVARGGPVVPADFNGQFIPIVRSVVIIQPDLRTRRVFTERFFGTLVHEMGHALGLQHTWTSSVMSTQITRSSSIGRPLTADDIAGISTLYPKPGYLAGTGSISGRVTLGAGGVNLASVVAINPNGGAVSTLTNPDGTYRIDGLAPRSYYVYVHPLPPAIQGESSAGGIVYPVDSQGNVYLPTPTFETVFYPGARNAQFAAQIDVPAGSVRDNINFAVRARAAAGLVHSVEAYAYPGEVAVRPSYISGGMLRPYLVATGYGLMAGGAPVPGLSASVLGGADLRVSPLTSAYLQLFFDQGTLAIASNSARHLVFSTPNDIYVLPSAFYHVEKQAPMLQSVAAAPGTAVLTGVNLTAETRVLFDGLAAQVRSFDEGSGRLTVTPPPAAAGHRAAVVAVNPDGQSSLFYQPDNPPVFVYPSDAPQASVAAQPAQIHPGVETVLQIDGVNTAFADGPVTLAFGSSDVVVKRIWVAGPNRLVANLAVSPAANPGSVNLSVVSGIQTAVQPGGVVIQPAPARPFWLFSPTAGVASGGTATLQIGAAPQLASGGLVAVLNDSVRVPATAANGQVSFQLPANTPTGTAVVRIESGTDRSLPIAIQVDPPQNPAGFRIVSMTTMAGEAKSLKPGEFAVLTVADMGEYGDAKLAVTIGGKEGRILQVLRNGDRHVVFVQAPDDVAPAENVPVVVTAGARSSEPLLIAIAR